MKHDVITLPFDVALLPITQLQAGKLSCRYEHGNLRTIKWGETEIVQMIYSAVRDAHWQTAPYEITNETIETTDQSFSISYTALYSLNDIRYKAQFRITGAAEGTLSFHMQGEALSDFKRNRIGICVLHPIAESVGKEVVVMKAGGTSYKAHFPQAISPHQPFLDIAQLQYRIDDVDVQLQFEGDVFETEDQRNWTDSSYKTYSTPLRLPIPAEVKKGDTIEQKVTVQLIEKSERPIRIHNEQVHAHEQKILFPKLGFYGMPVNQFINEQAHEVLKKLPFRHYRTELQLNDPAWKETLQQAAAAAKGAGVLLELIVFFSNEPITTTTALLEALQESGDQLFSILILHQNEKATPQALLQKWYPLLKQAIPNVPVGYGTNGNFADLNRNRPGETPHDFVSFSLYPQVHATDTRTILENLQTQHHTIETARTFTPKPVHISPASFAGRHLTAADPRQHSHVAAWWLLKTLQNLGSAGSITFGLGAEVFDTTPVYEMLARLNAFDPAWIVQKDGAAQPFDEVVFENNAGDRLAFTLTKPENW